MSEGASELPVSATSGKPKKEVSIWEIFLTFLIIGGTSFGGGVVAYLRNSLVSTKEWLDEDEFLTVLEISQTLPGLNATNMAVLVGDRLRGIPGAIAGFVGMTLPGSIIVFVLGLVYASNSHNDTINAVLKGIGAASVGLLLAVTLKIGHKQLEHYLDIIIVSVTLILVSFMHVSLLLVLVTVGPIAVFLYRPHTLSRDKSGTDKKAAD
ncbi:MAG: chromate transporter [Chthoniobacterales bacterium]